MRSRSGAGPQDERTSSGIAKTTGFNRIIDYLPIHHAAIIGVSKTAWPKAAVTPAQFEVDREAETRPLIVTCIGIDLGAAKARLRAMHGRKRVPTLLKWVARLAKGGAA